MPCTPALKAGALVEIVGHSDRGEYAPIVAVERLTVESEGKFPEARPVAIEQLCSGQEDSQFVEVRGLVRSMQFDRRGGYSIIEIETGGQRVQTIANALPSGPSQDLVDSTVRARGVCVSRFNLRRQLFNLRLLVPRAEDLAVEKPPAGDTFASPAKARPISSLLQFSPEGAYGHRVKVAGTVIYRQSPNILYIEDDVSGLFVQTAQPENVAQSDHVEVLGFAATGEYNPMMEDAVFRKAGVDAVPKPDDVTTDEALKGTHDCRLVRVEATVLDRAHHSQEQFLVLQSGGFIFHAYLERKGVGTDFAYLQNGCTVAVTGVCVIDPGSEWHAGEDWRAKSFRILLRSANDIELLQTVPWWNLQKALWIAGALAVAALAALAWVGLLRRKVHQQTGIIRQQLQAEATLKERYEDLFENANDFVYTHDLTGRITSLNQAGEELLGVPRQQALTRNILDFVAEEQRPAARQWLEQLGRGTSRPLPVGADPPTVEWDFVSASGQRMRLEISARLIALAAPESRSRAWPAISPSANALKREILEISNREQRRIGHDLHDGVCQQLAGIAFMTASLADQLQEKGVSESAQTERIGGLINKAIAQTRAVAAAFRRSSLRKTASFPCSKSWRRTRTSSSSLSACLRPRNRPAVENEVALHLCYIVLEAVANASKHGKAKNISITLAPSKGPLCADHKRRRRGLRPGEKRRRHGRPHHALSRPRDRGDIELAERARLRHACDLPVCRPTGRTLGRTGRLRRQRLGLEWQRNRATLTKSQI